MSSMDKGEDIILWPDDTSCLGEDLEKMTHMSDDYQRIAYGTPEWDAAAKKLGYE